MSNIYSYINSYVKAELLSNPRISTNQNLHSDISLWSNAEKVYIFGINQNSFHSNNYLQIWEYPQHHHLHGKTGRLFYLLWCKTKAMFYSRMTDKNKTLSYSLNSGSSNNTQNI
jgi:hypothetical protein